MARDAEIILVDSLEEVQKLVTWAEGLKAKQVVAVDTETTGFDYRDRVRTIQVGDRHHGFVIPYERGGWGGIVPYVWSQLEQKQCRIVLHNFCFDQKMLAKDKLLLPDQLIYDTRIMAHIVDPSRKTGLKDLADRYVEGGSSDGEAYLKKLFNDYGFTWATVPIDHPDFWFYAGLDTVITARLFDELEPQVFPRFNDIYELEQRSQVILRGVEERGVRIDLDYCTSMVTELTEEARELADVALEKHGVQNLGSSKQVADRLIEEGWEPIQFTNTGQPTMDRHVLAEVATRFELAHMTVEYKHLLKMAGKSYLGGYWKLVDDDNRLHPSINPIGARTGRMSVSGPPLQTLHRDAMVRDAFIPSEGNLLIFADYDQMEVRLTAGITGDPSYIEVILNSKDVHKTSAAQIYGISEDEVTKALRSRVKNVVYAKLYGAGPAKFAKTANISVDEAESFMQMFDKTFPAIKTFMDHVIGKTDPVTRKRVKRGIAEQRFFDEGIAYVMSPYGRRHLLGSHEVWTEGYGDGELWLKGPLYKLMNYLVQGTGADVLKHAIVDAERAGISDYLVLLVHDEMGWDVPKKEVDEVSHTIREVMEEREKFPVPLTVGMDVCERWGDKYADTRTRISQMPDLRTYEPEVDLEALASD